MLRGPLEMMDELPAGAACPALAAGGGEQVWQRNGCEGCLELISVFAWAREKGEDVAPGQDTRNDSVAHWIRQKPVGVSPQSQGKVSVPSQGSLPFGYCLRAGISHQLRN